MHAKIISLPVAVVAALLLSACDDSAPKQGAAAGAGGGRPAVEVSALTATPTNVPVTADLPGRTTAFRVAEVRPQVSGIVLKRLFEEGRDVEAGQQLYQIDPAPYQAVVQSAQADLVKARASLKSVEAKAARYAELVKINAVSRQDYDDVVASLDQAKAQIMVAQAAVDTARINLDYTRVYAPISGRIAQSSVTEGALVTANQAAAMTTITQLDPIYVDLKQSSADLMRMKQAAATGALQNAAGSTPVTLMIDGLSKAYAHPGELKFSDVTVDESTGAVQVRAVFPNPDRDLFPGLFVRARVEQGVRENVFLIPQQAVVRTPTGETQVWVVNADNTVAPRPVTAPQAVGDAWLVTGGLSAGDVVVTAGLQKIRPGMTVKVAAPASQSAAPAAAPQK